MAEHSRRNTKDVLDAWSIVAGITALPILAGIKLARRNPGAMHWSHAGASGAGGPFGFNGAGIISASGQREQGRERSWVR